MSKSWEDIGLDASTPLTDLPKLIGSILSRLDALEGQPAEPVEPSAVDALATQLRPRDPFEVGTVLEIEGSNFFYAQKKADEGKAWRISTTGQYLSYSRLLAYLAQAEPRSVHVFGPARGQVSRSQLILEGAEQ